MRDSTGNGVSPAQLIELITARGPLHGLNWTRCQRTTFRGPSQIAELQYVPDAPRAARVTETDDARLKAEPEAALDQFAASLIVFFG